jgi:hypothetical protein
MAVRDVGVGQDGSIIICTESGSAWRKEKRVKIKDAGVQRAVDPRSKDYKFVRVPGLSRVVAVRSNAFGAYAVAQRRCDVASEQITVDDPTLWYDILPLFPFRDLIQGELDGRWVRSTKGGLIQPTESAEPGKRVAPFSIESRVKEILIQQRITDFFHCPIWISTTTSDVRIPMHEFILAGRSVVIRQALSEFRKSHYHPPPDILSIEYDKGGEIQFQFRDIDFLSIFILVLYLYTDMLYEVWLEARFSPRNAAHLRQIRVEVIKIGSQLGLRNLESAARVMAQPEKVLPTDMECAFQDPGFFESGDVVIELKGAEIKVHSQIMCQRCPFFLGLFHGRAGGQWLSTRRGLSACSGDAVHIDLKHVDPNIFNFVLRHIYADTDDELFEDVKVNDLDDFVDLIIDVLAIANELMLERLAQICQKLLGRFGNLSKCQFLAVANGRSEYSECLPFVERGSALFGNTI